jgi:iron complex transport system substrate-binding protein
MTPSSNAEPAVRVLILPIRDDGEVRIVSLLPSATEIVYELGLGSQLCGVSFECDYPEAARSVPVVSGTALPTDGSLSAQQIDSEVTTRVSAGLSIYTLDDARIRAIDPDLILAQDLCRVCAVPSGAVEDALEVIGCHAQVLSLDPSRLDDVIEGIGDVGKATDTEERANMVMADLHRRLAAVRRHVSGKVPPRVLVLEWPDPLFNAGHWVPDMVVAAGGIPVLASPGERSQRIDWAEVEDQQVDVTIFSPCGFDLAGAVDQATALLAGPGASRLGRVYAVDANAHFSRPGPRVVDGVELLAVLIHSDSPAEVPAERARQLV